MPREPPVAALTQVSLHPAADTMQNGRHSRAWAFVGAGFHRTVQSVESAQSCSSLPSAHTTKGTSRRLGPHVAWACPAMPMARFVVGLRQRRGSNRIRGRGDLPASSWWTFASLSSGVFSTNSCWPDCSLSESTSPWSAFGRCCGSSSDVRP